MLSHDNMVWTSHNMRDVKIDIIKDQVPYPKYVSYLPLSHVAAQYVDLFLTVNNGVCVYFADVNALRGTLVNYLQEVRPIFFLGVPRVYEKMQEKVQAALESKKKIFEWAKYVAHPSNGSMETSAPMLR